MKIETSLSTIESSTDIFGKDITKSENALRLERMVLLSAAKLLGHAELLLAVDPARALRMIGEAKKNIYCVIYEDPKERPA